MANVQDHYCHHPIPKVLLVHLGISVKKKTTRFFGLTTRPLGTTSISAEFLTKVTLADVAAFLC